MDIFSNRIRVESKGHTDIIDITVEVQKCVDRSGFEIGVAQLFAIGSTLSLTTIEYEPGLVGSDMAELFEKMAPYSQDYAHNRTWGDDNGAAHLRSSLLGTALAVPFEHGKLVLGSWQQLVLIDFDTRPRSREVVCQLHGR